ncbi:Aste57867_2070 [Aphanomyces stellatus]|uniref:Aste57867_2070 protein n=1 Tax=Aphanomyces stellatus TaxID=120398 RepID=A0A485K6L9_9STRA|nr:hypothetical protein As57867_002066 [Aphanomyces stellatus]VFT79273.1 Aste57867_2070 [Aphanomyces stellatus]
MATSTTAAAALASTTTHNTCYFNGCHSPVAPGTWRCQFHQHREKCRVEGCRNHSSGAPRGTCAVHGSGGRKVCRFPGCDANTRNGILCYRHSGSAKKKARCNVDGCTRFAHARQRCVAHGGGRRCNVAGCQSQSRNGGLCQRHGGNMKKGESGVGGLPLRRTPSVASSTTTASPSRLPHMLDNDSSSSSSSEDDEQDELTKTHEPALAVPTPGVVVEEWCDVDLLMLEMLLNN